MAKVKVFFYDVERRHIDKYDAIQITPGHLYIPKTGTAVFVASGTQPALTSDKDKTVPAYFAIGNRFAAIAMTPELYARVALALRAANPREVYSSLSSLLEETTKRLVDLVRSGKEPRVELHPMLRIAVAVDSIDALTAPLDFILNSITTVSSVTHERITKFAEVERRILSEIRELEKVRVKEKASRWLLIPLGIGLAILLIGVALAILNQFGVLKVLLGGASAAAHKATSAAATHTPKIVERILETVTKTPPK